MGAISCMEERSVQAYKVTFQFFWLICLCFHWFQTNFFIVTPKQGENQEFAQSFTRAGCIDLEEPWHQSQLRTTSNTNTLGYPWSAGETSALPAWGQDGGPESWTAFAVRRVRDVHRLCWSNMTSRAAPTYLWCWVRSKPRYLRILCSTWVYPYAPAYPSIGLMRCWDPSLHCASARFGFPWEGERAHGPKGTWVTPHPFPTTITWDIRAWEFKYSLKPSLSLDSGDKNCIFPLSGMVLTVRTPTGKTEHLCDSHHTGCCYPLFVQQLRWQLPLHQVGRESWSEKVAWLNLFFSSSPQQVFESWGDDN